MSEIIGNRIIQLTEVDSTNNYAMSESGNKSWQEGTIIVTKYQNKGRGQVSNYWESEFGKNLLFSILLKPIFLPVQRQFEIAKIVTISLCDVLDLYVDNVSIKWPNDIYVNDRKISGILIENSIMGAQIGSCVVGVGLNVNQEKFLSDAPNPISLCQHVGKEIQLDSILELLIERLNFWYAKLKGGEELEIDSKYHERLYQRGVRATYLDADGEFQGSISGVNEIGQLEILDQNSRKRTYHFKEVSFC